ncbi:M42 family metallopeptidase [Staphylococcus massiliensis]|uniref:M42 family metallopeptidase n=1 Tax=Staphylococcus massiliensis TaxID=555791 RepID=UPI001EDE86EE|nr:M42 family metallopeptidase [Staphylococcus massiliensis]MCG3399718.1 M42 family metallopeptidase [Staphylococcus massiliensis]
MEIRNETTIARIKILTELHGAPNFEDKVRAYLKKEMEPYVDEFVDNRMGGFFGVKKSNKPSAKRVMIAAHMDEIGFMVTEITKEGLLKFTNLGGVANDIWQGQRLRVRTRDDKELTGVVSNIPKHYRTGKEGAPAISDLMLDIGCASPEEVREMGVEIGDSIVPDTTFKQLTEHRYLAKAWDNRYGCVLALEILDLLKDVDLDVDLYVGANVQEELGLRGARASSELIDPDVSFVVDCSPANDMKGKSGLSGALGEGTLIRIKDGTMMLKPEFRDYLLDIANNEIIPHQYYMSPGGTDGGEIHKSNIGVPTAVIGVCARYIHSTDALFDLRDYFAARQLLQHAILNLNDDTIKTLQYGK